MSSGLLKKGFSSVDKIRSEIRDRAVKIMAEAQEIIIDLNTSQLYQGIDNKGQKLRPKYRNVRYKKAKNSVNPLPGLGTPDLKLTGQFYSNFYLVPEGGDFTKFSLFSSDEKASKLESKYGKDIFGLTVKNEKILNQDIILPQLSKWMLSKLKI